MKREAPRIAVAPLLVSDATALVVVGLLAAVVRALNDRADEVAAWPLAAG